MTAELVIKVSIADDHKIFRDGIKMALKNKEYLRILWEAEDGKDLVHKMQIKRPDVLLMDIRMLQPGRTKVSRHAFAPEAHDLRFLALPRNTHARVHRWCE